MKVAVDVQSLYDTQPSGVGHYVMEVLRELVKTPEVEFILFSTGRREFELAEDIASLDNVTHVHKKIPNKLAHALMLVGGISLSWLIGQDVDAVWFPNTGFLPRTKVFSILTVHDLAWALMPDTYTWLHHLRYRLTRSRTQIKRAHKIIAASESTRNDVIETFGKRPSNVVTILHGVAHDRFDANTKSNDATLRQRLDINFPYVVSLATLEPRKNLSSLVEAFDLVKDKGVLEHLVLAGGNGWKRRQLNKSVKHSRYRDYIHILNYVPSDSRPALLRGATCLCLPSRYEGFGMQVLEAMACGTPVITSRNSSLMEVGLDTIVTARAMDVEACAQVLHEVLRNKQLRTTMRHRALKRSKDFDWASTAKQTLEVLTSSSTDTKPVAIIDIDGTLYREEWMRHFIEALVPQISSSKIDELWRAREDARQAWESRAEGFARFRKADVELIYESVKHATYDTFISAGHRVFEQRKHRTSKFVEELIKHVSSTHHTVAITGTNYEIMKHVQKLHGIDELHCSLLDVEGDTVKGVAYSPWLEGKDKITDRLVSEHGRAGSIGIGDEQADIKVLERVDTPIVFNPTMELTKMAHERRWPIVIERKNTIHIWHKGQQMFLDAHKPLPWDLIFNFLGK